MTNFSIGDEVIIVNGTDYSYTTEGSEGIVVEILEGEHITVAWYKLTGPYEVSKNKPRTWSVCVRDIALLKANLNNHPCYKVIRKVNQLQRKRKEKGYAF
jgi:hypothetical protein